MRKERNGWRNIRHLIWFLFSALVGSLDALLYSQSPHLQSTVNHMFIINSNSIFTLKTHLFHEEKDLVSPTPDIVLNFLGLHLRKILDSIWPLYDAEVSDTQKRCRIQCQHVTWIFNNTSQKRKTRWNLLRFSPASSSDEEQAIRYLEGGHNEVPWKPRRSGLPLEDESRKMELDGEWMWGETEKGAAMV